MTSPISHEFETKSNPNLKCTKCGRFQIPSVGGSKYCHKCNDTTPNSNDFESENETKGCSLEEGSTDAMSIIEFCKMHDIPTMPIRVDLKKTNKRLQDDSFKQEKKLLGNDLLGKVTTNDFKNKKLCEKRWNFFNETNPDGYNMLAWDTTRVRVIDVDCILPPKIDGVENPIITLAKNHPFKKSSSKSFGKHIIVVDDVPLAEKPRKQNLPLIFGADSEDKAGVEYLNGLWAWSKMDAVVYQASKPLELDTSIIDIKKELENANNELKNTKKKQKFKIKKRKQITPTAPPPASSSVVSSTSGYDLELLKKRLEEKEPSYYANYQKASGAILRCASTQNEEVYKVVLEVMKREGSNFSTEEWVRNKWNEYDATKHSTFTMDWYQTPYLSPLKLFTNDENVGRAFLDRFKKDLIVQVDKKKRICGVFAWTPEAHNTWSSNLKDSKGYAPLKNYVFEKIVNIIQPDYIKKVDKLFEYKQKEYEMQKTEENLEGKELNKKEKELEELQDVIGTTKHDLKKTNKLKGYVAWIEGMVLADLSLQREVQFNLEKSTKHLFQFKNGAYDLKEGKLIARTKHMYITSHLDYDYSEEVDESAIKKLEAMLKQSLPDDTQRDGFMKFHGYCLTGETREQMFLLNIGYGAENGKSTWLVHFRNAFPIYCKQIGANAFDTNNDSAFNKVFSSLADQPIRIAYMEEWGGREQDMEKVKETVDLDVINVKPLYQAEIDMQIQFKLIACANNDPNTAGLDNGYLRRGRQLNYESKFVDEEDEVDVERHRYLKDRKVMEFCKDENHALALFHMFKGYAKKYYKEGVNLPACMKATFTETSASNDKYHDFFEDFIRPKHDGLVAKIDLQCHWNDEDEFKKLRKAFQKRGYKYDSQLKIGGKKGYFKDCIFLPLGEPM